MELVDLKTGDIVFRCEAEFVSNAIQFWMKVYGRKKGYNVSWIPSHIFTLVWINSILYSAESVDNGFHLREFNKHYKLGDNLFICRVNEEYTPNEQIEIFRYAKELETVSVGYAYPNFVAWPIYILTGINIFPSKLARKINYCYQSTRMILEHMRSNWMGNTAITSFWDVYQPDKLKIIYDNRK
jgi:hypothetical protein